MSVLTFPPGPGKLLPLTDARAWPPIRSTRTVCPIMPMTLPRSSESAARSGHSPRPLSVLVVEDNPDTLRTTALLLRLAGHAAVAAATGPDALKAAAGHAPDVVLLDV